MDLLFDYNIAHLIRINAIYDGARTQLDLPHRTALYTMKELSEQYYSREKPIVTLHIKVLVLEARLEITI